jgi:protein transport protein HofC
MKKISPSTSIAFFEGLQGLLDAGLNLVTALQIQEGEQKKIAVPIRTLIAGLRAGQPFSQVLSGTLVLPPFVLVNIRLGESSGDLAHACSLCARALSDQQRWKRLCWHLSFYPLVLILTSLVLCGVMLGFVLPEFASLYETLNVSLPPSTAWLLQAAKQAPPLMEKGCYLLFLAILSLCLCWKNTEGREMLEGWALRFPGINKVWKHQLETQLALQLGTLLQGGCPLTESLHFMRQSTRSPSFARYLWQVDQRIRQGQSLSKSFCHTLLQAPRFKVLIMHAEQTGQFDKVLLHLAEQQTQALKHWQDQAKHIIQPIITLLMGGFLGFWILLLYYPMLQLGTNLG